MRMPRAIGSALVLGATLAAGAARAEGRTLTVDQAVALVEQNNPRVLAVLALSRGGKDQARSALGRMLPSVHLNDEYQHWDSPYAYMGLAIRDQDTNQLAVAADQPLLGLIHLAHDHEAEGRRAEATEAQLETARADLRAAVQTQYLRLFEAKGLAEVARASERELTEQVTVTQAKLNAGVATTADLLRVQVAAANAKQQEILAHSQEEVARASLLGAVGLPQSDTQTQFAEPTALLEGGSRDVPQSIDEADRRAQSARPELREKRLQADAAHHGQKARLFSLLPEVDAEAAYLRTDGSIFNPHNAGYFGIKATWAIFEWGASYYAQHAAAEQAEAADHDAEDTSRRIGVEVATDLSQLRAATAAVDVARQTIASAEEAYRVTQALMKAGTATTTDLLDSEAALTQARLNLERARYEQAIAQVALRRGLGVR